MIRAVILAATLLAGLLGRAPAAGHRAPNPADFRLLKQAAGRLGHEKPATVIRWLQRQPIVASAALGLDGQTVSITFRDGMPGAVLPRLARTVAVPGALLRAAAHLQPKSVVQQTSPQIKRAAVWEPFANALFGPVDGPHSGDIIARYLEDAGYVVDTAYNSDVNLALMYKLSQYNVVYIHTHTGVNQWGEADLTTGQLADNQQTPLWLDGDKTLSVGVDGDPNHLWVAIASDFITSYLSPFQPNSLLFVNGCDLMTGTRFTKALFDKGLTTFVSWNSWVAPRDGYFTGNDFFYRMSVSRLSVADAITAVKNDGFGVSQVEDQPQSVLSYLGDGTLTLYRPMPTPTPVPTATPKPVPTATATPVPPPLAATLNNQVRPGEQQTIAVTTSPGAVVHFRVDYPNGDHQSKSLTADSSGAVQYSYVQGPSKISHTSFDATVEMRVGQAPAVTTLTDHYRILYGPIDVSVEPRLQLPGEPVTIWVHTSPYTKVSVAITQAGGMIARLQGRTGPGGWVHLRYRTSADLQAGSKIVVLATGSGQPATKTFFHVGS